MISFNLNFPSYTIPRIRGGTSNWALLTYPYKKYTSVLEYRHGSRVLNFGDVKTSPPLWCTPCKHRIVLLMIINSWTRTASAAYAPKIMTLTTAHSPPLDMHVYRLLGRFCMLDHVCVEPGCVPSSEYAFKNWLSATIHCESRDQVPHL